VGFAFMVCTILIVKAEGFVGQARFYRGKTAFLSSFLVWSGFQEMRNCPEKFYSNYQGLYSADDGAGYSALCAW
jgi:hypothetical protein